MCTLNGYVYKAKSEYKRAQEILRKNIMEEKEYRIEHIKEFRVIPEKIY